MDPIVIIGGGHAAAQLCGALAEGGCRTPVMLVSEDAYPPYHRPPLSKTVLKDDEPKRSELRGEAFYEESGVTLRLATRATRIDRDAQQVELVDADGNATLQPYSHLVLATGGVARWLPGLPDDTEGAYRLRSYDDALRLREALNAAGHLMVLGGGFIGLEAAAAARSLGKQVTVIEAAPRLLARAVSPEASVRLLDSHRENGVDIRIGSAPDEVVVENGRFVGVRVAGERLDADLLLIGIGALPEVGLAETAGLECDNGVVVDGVLATSDPHVSAIGDCTSFPWGADGGRIRLESVQNANDQAKALAARLLGAPQTYAPIPTFWSDQGTVRMQIVGLWRPEFEAIVREGAKPGSLSVYHYEGDALRAVESLNAPLDHVTAKKWFAAGHSPARDRIGDSGAELKSL